jgi:streptogramin lyase
VHLREGDFGEAAWWLQRAVAGGARDVAPLRALAVRGLLRTQGMGGGWGAPQDVVSTEIKRAAGLLRLPSGTHTVLDGKAMTLISFARDGRRLPTEIGDVQAAAARPDGKLVVAAGEQLFLLDPERSGAPEALAALGRFAPVAALAVDGAGEVWIADRKGSRLGRLAVGATEPQQVVESKTLRVEALAPLPPGRGVAILDTRAGALFAVDPDGTLHPVAALPWGDRGRPVALASDPAGQLAVLDGKSGEVVLMDAQGNVRDRLAPPTDRDAPVAIALGADGSLDLVTGDGRLRRAP